MSGMTEVIQLSTAFEQPSAVTSRAEPVGVRTDAVYVVFTTPDDTVAAARVAASFAGAMSVPVTVVHFRSVPYPLSIDAPVGISPVETDSFVARLESEGVHVRIRVFLCRRAERA